MSGSWKVEKEQHRESWVREGYGQAAWVQYGIKGVVTDAHSEIGALTSKFLNNLKQ